MISVKNTNFLTKSKIFDKHRRHVPRFLTYNYAQHEKPLDVTQMFLYNTNFY